MIAIVTNQWTRAARILKDGAQWIQMGCHLRTRADWETNPWNNPSEFPNDGSAPSEARQLTLKLAMQWLDANAPCS